MTAFEIEVITTPERFAQLAPEWSAFLEQLPGHPLVHTPAYLQALFPTLTASQGAYFVTFRRPMTDGSAALVAVAAGVIKAGPLALKLGVIRLGSVKVKRLSLLGNRLSCAPGLTEAVLGAFLAELRKSRIDLVDFDCLSTDGELYPLLHAGAMPGYRFQAATTEPQPLRGIRFNGSFADYLESMSKKTRYNLKRSVKQLEAHCAEGLHVRQIRTPDEVPGFFEHLNQVYAQTWQAGVFGKATRNRTATVTQHQALAAAGVLRSFVLLCGDLPLAYLRGYQYQGVYDFEEIGYVQSWRDHQPGTVLNLKVIEALFAADMPELLSFGYGENDYKRILGNWESGAVTGYLVAHGTRAARVVTLQAALQSLYIGLRSLSQRLGLDTYLRRLIKRR